MKKLFAMLLALAMALSMAACGSGNSGADQAASNATAGTAEPSGDAAGAEEPFPGKIGIMVSTIATNEEEYRTAEKWQETYGKEKIVIQTYPDNFMKEQETTISNLLSMVSDPEIKAVVFVSAVPGAAAAISKAKEKRPDVLYIAGNLNEDPSVVAPVADLIIDVDWVNNANQMVDRAKEMGADTLIFYNFPRLMGYARNQFQYAQAETRCAEVGIEFVPLTMPDPMSDAGTAGTQQFCREDVPKQLEKYGPNTSFWDINTASTPAVIKALLDAGEGIYMNPNSASPFAGYPEAFGIAVPSERKGDSEWVISELGKVAAEHDASGRFSTRAFPVVANCMNTGVAYAIKYLQGVTTEKADQEVARQCFAEVTNQTVESASFTVYDNPENGEHYDNMFMVLAPWAML